MTGLGSQNWQRLEWNLQLCSFLSKNHALSTSLQHCVLMFGIIIIQQKPWIDKEGVNPAFRRPNLESSLKPLFRIQHWEGHFSIVEMLNFCIYKEESHCILQLLKVMKRVKWDEGSRLGITVHIAGPVFLQGLQAHGTADCTAITVLFNAVGLSMPALGGGSLPMAWVKYPSEGLHSPSLLIQIFSFKPASAVLWQEVFWRRTPLWGALLWSPGCPTVIWGLGQASWALRPAAGLRHSGGCWLQLRGLKAQIPTQLWTLKDLSLSLFLGQSFMCISASPAAALSSPSVGLGYLLPRKSLGWGYKMGSWLSQKKNELLLLIPLAELLGLDSPLLPVTYLGDFCFLFLKP